MNLVQLHFMELQVFFNYIADWTTEIDTFLKPKGLSG